MWFEIKCKPSIIFGSRHVYNLIPYLHPLNNDTIIECVKLVIHIKKFIFFELHSENILLCMHLDDDSSLRKFIIPKVQFSSNSYYEWITFDITLKIG